MKTYGLRDVIGPIMVGPSSSHTAGALALASMARKLFGEQPERAVFTLYGSFAATGSGHGTDKALVAGILGLATDDPRVADAFALAKAAGVQVDIVWDTTTEVAHPNTVDIRCESREGRTLEMRGVSIGGGAAVIRRINGIDVDITGERTSVVVHQRDERGVLAHIAGVLAGCGINIANANLHRTAKRGDAYTVLETDSAVDASVRELLMDLDASDEQLDCPFLYASAKMGHAVLDLNDTPKDMTPLFETILKYIPAPTGDPEAGTQLLISTIDYNEYVGRIGVGKVENGTIRVNQDVMLVNHHDLTKKKKVKVSKLYEFDGLKKVEVTEAGIGSIVAVSGIPDIHIGDTLCGDLDNPVSIPFQKISEPTISMNFIVNDSPLAGKEGKYVTSRHLRDRLMRELNTDVSLRVEETDSADCFKVSGRGELHLSVLIENMRREGYEFAVSKAEVIYKEDERGRKLEPMEIAYVDVPDEFSGTVIQLLSERKGELHGMSRASDGSTRLEFEIPARGLIGFRGIFMTSTKGTGILNTEFEDYAPYKGDIEYRKQGSLIAFEAGESVTYGLYSAQERGTLFIGPGEKVYAGMVIGQNGKAEDIELNVCKTKHLTNTRTSSSDEALRLTPPRILSLEQALDFIDKDELLEVTPVSLRIRKKELDSRLRKRAAMK